MRRWTVGLIFAACLALVFVLVLRVAPPDDHAAMAVAEAETGRERD